MVQSGFCCYFDHLVVVGLSVTYILYFQLVGFPSFGVIKSAFDIGILPALSPIVTSKVAKVAPWVYGLWYLTNFSREQSQIHNLMR